MSLQSRMEKYAKQTEEVDSIYKEATTLIAQKCRDESKFNALLERLLPYKENGFAAFNTFKETIDNYLNSTLNGYYGDYDEE